MASGAGEFSWGRILALQATIAITAALASAMTRRGDAPGILLGAGVVAGSLLLQIWATRAAFSGTPRAALAVGAVALKVGLLLGGSAVLLGVTGVAPIWFAAGVTTMPLAIVIDACYGSLLGRRHARDAGSDDPAGDPKE